MDATVYSHNEDTEFDSWKSREVKDLRTCALKYPFVKLDSISEDQKNKTDSIGNQNYFKVLRESGKFSNIMFVLFSMTVPIGFIAGFSPLTFYVAVVYGMSGSVRSIIWSTWMGFCWEVTNPEPMIKLIECCYIMRHEENLV